MAFTPGPESMQQAGIPATVGPYVGTNAQQIRMSLDQMSQAMRAGSIDASVRGWALGCLKQNGLDGRDLNTTPFKQAAALLECFRRATVYAPDPYASELIPSAGATLCLRPNLCLSGDDCDGLTVAYGSLCLSIGIPVQIVKQSYGGGAQDHVLCAVFVGDDWKYADPSTNLPFGEALPAESEEWVDPFGQVGTLPEQQPRIVTFGRPRGFAAAAPPSLPDPNYTDVQPNDDFSYNIAAGNRYRFGITVLKPNNPPGATVLTQAQMQTYILPEIVIESMALATSGGTSDPARQSYWVQGIPTATTIIADVAPDGALERTFFEVAVQNSPQPHNQPKPNTLKKGGQQANGGIGIGTIGVIGIGLLLAGGIAFAIWQIKEGKHRGRKGKREEEPEEEFEQ